MTKLIINHLQRKCKGLETNLFIDREVFLGQILVVSAIRPTWGFEKPSFIVFGYQVGTVEDKKIKNKTESSDYHKTNQWRFQNCFSTNSNSRISLGSKKGNLYQAFLFFIFFCWLDGPGSSNQSFKFLAVQTCISSLWGPLKCSLADTL